MKKVPNKVTTAATKAATSAADTAKTTADAKVRKEQDKKNSANGRTSPKKRKYCKERGKSRNYIRPQPSV